MMRKPRRGATARWAALVLAPILGCGGDDLTPPDRVQDRELYWALDLDHHAVTLAMRESYDTLTLVATPRNYLGEPLAAATPPTYQSMDPDRVSVTPDGVLRARAPLAPGAKVTVRATLELGDVAYTDSVWVYVAADTAPRLATFSIHPVPPDSAKVGAVHGRSLGVPRVVTDTLFARATTAAGLPLTDLLVSFRSSDTTVAQIDRRSGEIVGLLPGKVRMYGSATVFGVAKADTLAYRVGWPVIATIRLSSHPEPVGPQAFRPSDVTIGAGGMVAWDATAFDLAPELGTIMDIRLRGPGPAAAVNTSSGLSTRVFYVHAIACLIGNCDADGDVTLQPSNYPPEFGGGDASLGAAGRVFPVPGTYDYYSNVTGASGRIVVVDER